MEANLTNEYISAIGGLLTLAFFGCVAFGSCVASLTELTKDWNIKTAWFYRAVAMVFSVGISLLFAHKVSATLSVYDKVWLVVCTYAGSQGWYEKLKHSDSWFGKFFTSLTDKYFASAQTAVEAETEVQVGESVKIAKQVTTLSERFEKAVNILEKLGIIKTEVE